MKRLVLWTALGLLISLASVLVGAEDFTFHVPVELHKIPSDIKSFSINAWVFNRAEDKDGYCPSGARIGALTFGPIPIVNGEYVGVVTLKFNADYHKDPATAVSYRVDLLLNGPPPPYQGGCLNAMGLDTPYPYDVTKPIVCWAHGSIQQTATPRPSRKKDNLALQPSPSPNSTKRPKLK